MVDTADARTALVFSLLALRRALTGPVGERVEAARALAAWAEEHPAHSCVLPEWLNDIGDGTTLSDAFVDFATEGSSFDNAEFDTVVEPVERLLSSVFAEWEPGAPLAPDLLPIVLEDQGSGNRLSLVARLSPADDDAERLRAELPWSIGPSAAAHTALAELLGPLVGDAVSPPVVPTVPGAVTGVPLADADSAFSLALGLLAMTVGPSTRLGVLAVGRLVGTKVEPLARTEVDERRVLAAQLGCGLLAATDEGWTLWRHPRANPEHHAVTTRDLADAARLLWGAEWVDWVATRRRSALRVLGWSEVDLEATDPHQPIPDTPIEQVRQLRTILARQADTSVVLGGSSGTAKSAIVRLLAAALHEAGWRVVAVSPANGRLPDEDLMLAVGRAAFACAGGQRRLLVLEDIAPMGDERDLDVDELLSDVRQHLEVSVLAVLLYDVGIIANEWRVETTPVVRSVVGQSETMRFALSLLDDHPDELEACRPQLTTLVRRHYRDLRRLTESMVRVAESQSDPIDDSTIRALVASLRKSKDGALERLAAFSLLNNEVPAGDLYLEEEDLTTLGASRSPYRHGWRLPNQELCREILCGEASGRARQAPPGNEVLRRELTRHVAPQLVNITKVVGDGYALVIFLRNARHADEVVLRALLAGDKFHEAFTDWLEQVEVAVLAELVLAADKVLPDELLDELANALVRRCGDLVRDPLRTIGLRQMCTVLAALLRLRGPLGGSLPNCLNELAKPISELLRAAEAGRVRGAHRLLDLLPRFQHDPLTRLVAEQGAAVLRDLNPEVIRDYGIASRVHRLVTNAGRSTGVTVGSIAEEESVRRLLDHRTRARRGLPVMLASFSLKLQLEGIDDWDEFLHRRSQDIRTALPLSDVRELRFAIAELHRSDPAFCVRLLNLVPNLDTALRQLLRQETLPGEAAMLIGALANRHASLAFNILYRQHRPDRSLAASFVKRIKETGDTKGAGMLLMVAHAQDDWAGDPAYGFANLMAVELGLAWFKDEIKSDPRVSIVSHLIANLWRARPPFADEVLDAGVDCVVDAISYSLRRWGPQLALTLIEDPEIAAEFCDRLRERLTLSRIVEGMVEASASDARTAFHRLGRILYPQAATAFRDTYAVDKVQLSGSISSAMAYLVEAVKTLRSANARDTAMFVLRNATAQRANERVFKALKAPISPSELADGIRLMARLDPEYAATKINELNAGASAEKSILQRRVRNGMFFEPLGSASLMEATEGVLPGVGAGLLAYAMGKSQPWHAFTHEVQHMQNPTQQWVVSKQLDAVGLRYGQPQTGWMRKVFDSRLSTVGQLRSPRFIAELLRMLHLWDKDWASQAAEYVDAQRVAQRLRSTVVRDMGALPTMLSTLDLCGAHEKSAVIMGALAGLDPDHLVRRLGLRAAGQLLLWAAPRHLEKVDGLGVALAESVGDTVGSYLVRDEADHWSQIGWAMVAVDQVGARDSVPRRTPPVSPNQAFAAEVAWATSRLPEQPWTKVALRDALDKLTSINGLSLSEKFHTLAAASLAGRSAEFLHDGSKWADVSHFGVGQLAVLTRLGDRDPAIADLLRTHGAVVTRRLGDEGAIQFDPRLDEVEDWFSSQQYDLA